MFHCLNSSHAGESFEPKATTAPALALSDAGDQTLGLTPVLVAATYGQTKA